VNQSAQADVKYVCSPFDAPTHLEFKEFDTGRRHTWAEVRVM